MKLAIFAASAGSELPGEVDAAANLHRSAPVVGMDACGAFSRLRSESPSTVNADFFNQPTRIEQLG
jgi:hypothetical protein